MATIREINERLKATLPVATLSPGLFDNETAITKLLKAYFHTSGGELKISGVKPEIYKFTEATGVISFSGTNGSGPLEGMPISNVEIKISDTGEVRILVEANPPLSWNLTQSFPGLSNPVFPLLSFTQSYLCWASYDSDEDDTMPGFFLDSVMNQTEGLFALVKDLVPGTKIPYISGRILMKGNETKNAAQYVPEMYLLLEEAGEFPPIGPFKVVVPQFEFYSVPFFNEATLRWQSDNYLNISGGIYFKENFLKINAKIKDPRKEILITSSMEQPLAGAMQDLIEWIGGVKLEVPGFSLGYANDIRLKNLSILLNPSAQDKITSISITIGTSEKEKWQMWTEKIILSDIGITFRINPAAGTYGGEIEGLVNGWLRLRASFSSSGEYIFSGSLFSKVTLRDFYRFFTDTDNKDLPDLELSTFFAQVKIIKGEGGTKWGITGDLAVTGAWEITPKPIPFSLTGLMFKLDKSTEGTLKIEAGASFKIGRYSLGVDGSYHSQDGWVLNGEMVLGDKTPSMAELSTEMEKSFPVTDPRQPVIPAFLTGWMLKRLEAGLESKTKKFDFTAVIGNSELPALELGLGIHLETEGEKWSRKFEGHINYVKDDWEVKFDLTITQTGEGTARTTTVLGKYSSAKPPKLSRVLQALGGDLNLQENLPKELELDASVNGLALEIVQKDKDPLAITAAGSFTLEVWGNKLTLNVSFSNYTSFEANLGKPEMVNGRRAFVLGVGLGALLDLSKLPLVGSIPGVNTLKVERLGFYYTNAEFKEAGKKLYFRIPEMGSQNSVSPGTDPVSLSRKGFNLLGQFGSRSVDGKKFTPFGGMQLGMTPDPLTGPKKPVFTTRDSKPTTPIHWLDLNKTLGPVSLRKVGLNYTKGRATIGVSGGLSLGGFTLDLEGLSATFDVPIKGTQGKGTVGFDLQGLGIMVKRGNVAIGGFFMKEIHKGELNYYGSVMVKAGTFGFKAVGGYSPGMFPPSLFLYVCLKAPLGGVPEFFITGLAGGFGLNRALNIPSIDKLPGHILLPDNAPAQEGSPGDTIRSILPQFDATFPKKEGQYWFALGLSFTTYEMVEAFALVTISLGSDIELNILGSANMTFPRLAPVPVAYFELILKASFSPTSGHLALEGIISPASFVLGGFVKITGGFAFHLWFLGPHAGDFLISVGGYHPDFKKPDHYPALPRLGLRFALGPLQAYGEAYFALTPAMIMAGFRIRATVDLSIIQAWFDVGVDFLISWIPFHYEAHAFIHLGVSVNLGLFNLSLSLSTDLYVWGPPFGGRAEVDLSILKFTINFGAPAAPESPIGWKSFKEGFLPKDTEAKHPVFMAAALTGEPPAGAGTTNLLKADLATGLLQRDIEGYNWIADPDLFQIDISSSMPANYAGYNAEAWNKPNLKNVLPPNTTGLPRSLQLENIPKQKTFSATEWWNPTLHIAPMKKKDVKSYISVRLLRWVNGSYTETVSGIRLQPVLGESPAAMWGEHKDKKKPGDPAFVERTLKGFRILPAIRKPGVTSAVPLIQLLFARGSSTWFSYSPYKPDARFRLAIKTSGADELNIEVSGEQNQSLPQSGYVLSALSNTWVKTAREGVLNDLLSHSFDVFAPGEIDFGRLDKDRTLTDWPEVAVTGGALAHPQIA